MKEHPLYKGVFNYQHEVQTIYCHAVSLIHAHKLFMRRLSKIYDCSLKHMLAYFDGSRDNYKITREHRIEKKKRLDINMLW